MRFTRRVKGFATVAAVVLAACLTFGVASASAWNMVVHAHTKVDRPFTWTITKNAADPVVDLTAGQTKTENYTVTVTATAGAATNWKIYGDVTVGVDPDHQLGEITGAVDPYNILLSTFYLNAEQIHCPQALPYVLVTDITCTWGDVSLPDGSGGVVTLRGFESTTTGEQVRASAPFDFTNPDVVTGSDDCVDVTDTQKGALGHVCASTSPQTFTFTYTRTLGPYSECGQFEVPNTSTFTTDDSGATGSASATVIVKVAGCAAAGTLTPGYWKNHLAPVSASCKPSQGCSNNGPWTSQYLPQSLGNYSVDTTAKVTSVFAGMNCGSSTDQDAIGCLAGHLLAAKLNVANGASTCIAGTIANADAFLKGQTVSGVTGITYTGPSGSYSLSAAQRALAIQLKSTLDAYNNGTCP